MCKTKEQIYKELQNLYDLKIKEKRFFEAEEIKLSLLEMID